MKVLRISYLKINQRKRMIKSKLRKNTQRIYNKMGHK